MTFFSETIAVCIFALCYGSLQAHGLANNSLPFARITPRACNRDAACFYNRFGSDKKPTIQ